MAELDELIDEASKTLAAFEQVDQGEDLALEDGEGGRRTRNRDFLSVDVASLLVSDEDAKKLAKDVSTHPQ